MQRITWLNAEELFPEAVKKINPVNSILDVGCGIRPQTLARTFVHFCVDAHQQYLDVLKKNVSGQNPIKGRMKYLCLNKTTDTIVSKFPDKMVDSIFLLDVIEHLDKKKGLELIQAFTRIARHQVVIFTPLGFVKQEHADGKDAWGLDGGKWQEHRSGWMPGDFDETWEILACKDFHRTSNVGDVHEEPVGAFFAIKTMAAKPELIFGRNIFSKGAFWMNSFLKFRKLERL